MARPQSYKTAQPIKSVEMYATGDSVVAGLVPATSRRCCGIKSKNVANRKF
jgi:hypothetical protein